MALDFEQQPKESDKAFAAFAMYLSLGAQRSTAEVGKKLGKSAGLIEQWCTRWQWKNRVGAYGEHLARVEREATEALARSKSAEWLTRREALRETEWEMHEKCIAAARKALAKFLVRENVYANLSDIARILEVASKMGRLAAGMETDRTEITGEDGGPIKVELEVALKKIYGVEARPANDVAAPRGGIVEAEVIEDDNEDEGEKEDEKS